MSTYSMAVRDRGDEMLEIRLQALKAEIFAQIRAEESARLLSRLQIAAVVMPIISIVVIVFSLTT